MKDLDDLRSFKKMNPHPTSSSHPIKSPPFLLVKWVVAENSHLGRRQPD